MVENLSSNKADVGSIPGQGTGIPHATGQLSPRAAATEPQLESPRGSNCRAHALWNVRATTTGATCSGAPYHNQTEALERQQIYHMLQLRPNRAKNKI